MSVPKANTPLESFGNFAPRYILELILMSYYLGAAFLFGLSIVFLRGAVDETSAVSCFPRHSLVSFMSMSTYYFQPAYRNSSPANPGLVVYGLPWNAQCHACGSLRHVHHGIPPTDSYSWK